MSIQAIDHSTVHRLTSGQVVIDLQTAVKELLENALDAGATSVVITFKEHGLESIEVQDNGRGIDKEDWAGIALKHHTSKLTSFDDLTSVLTLGFRGEALSSLCGTATLSITTATAATAPAGTSLTFERSGTCVVGSKVARSKGTTVTIKELFKTLPVRRKELEKNHKRDFAKVCDLIQAYALIKTGCRFDVKNIVKGKSSTHLQTPIATTVRANYSSIFTPKALPSMLDFEFVLDVAADKSVLKYSEGGSAGTTQVVVKGLVSKPTTGNGRSTANRQFYYINGRPFSPQRLSKAVNEVYKSFNTNSFPSIVADFQLPPDAYDVNVSPDKRTIFLHSEGNLIAALKTAFEELFQPSRSTFPMFNIDAASASKPATAPSLKRSSSDVQAARDVTSSSPPKSTPTHSSSTSAAGDTLGLEQEEEDEEEPVAKRRRMSSEVEAAPASDDAPLEESGDMEDEVDELEISSQRGPDSDMAVDDGEDEDAGPASDEVDHEEHDEEEEEDGLETYGRNEKPPRPRNPYIDDEAGCSSRRRSPSASPSRSPSPASSARPQPLVQMTLDTTGASWAKKLDIGGQSVGKSLPAKGKGKASSIVGSFKSSIQQYLHPSQRGALGNDGQENEEEGDDGGMVGEDGEADERSAPPRVDKGKQRAVEVSDDSDDEMVVVEESFTAAATTRDDSDDEIEIVDDSSCPCSHGDLTKNNKSNKRLSPDELDDQEQQAHLASLDSAATSEGIAPSADEVTGAQLAIDTTVLFDLSTITADWTASAASALRSSRSGSPAADQLAGAGLQENADDAEATLSRVVTKDDFASMQVIGQFNDSFIIARRRVVTEGENDERQDDLFIVDQHASDEKYNFERLQIDTVIQSQRLIQPRALNLPSHDEITAIEHLDLLRLNGFDVLVNEDAEVGQRVKLIAQPLSKDTVFGVEDLEELLELIKASSSGEIVRPSKARRMFASRACRKSVMFGKSLNRNQMTTIVRHMGGMDQPWSCPHGRPTLRWLAGLGNVQQRDKRADLALVVGAYSSEEL